LQLLNDADCCARALADENWQVLEEVELVQREKDAIKKREQARGCKSLWRCDCGLSQCLRVTPSCPLWAQLRLAAGFRGTHAV
jgi:hypothetical protein